MLVRGSGAERKERGEGKTRETVRFLLFALVFSCFLAFALIFSCFRLFVRWAIHRRTLRLTLAIPRAGGLFCVPAVYFGNFPRRLFGRWPQRRGAAEIGPLCMTGERWGVAEKRPPPFLGRVGLFYHIHQTLPRAGVAEKQGMAFRGLCPEFLSRAYEGHGKA